MQEFILEGLVWAKEWNPSQLMVDLIGAHVMSKQSMEIATNKLRKKKTNPGRQKMGFEKLAEKLTGKKKR